MFDTVYYSNTIAQWLIGVGVAFGIIIVLKAAQRLLIWRLKKMAQRTVTDLDDLVVDMLGHTRFFFILTLALDAGGHLLTLPHLATRILDQVAVIGVLLQVALWGNQLVAYSLGKYAKAAEGESASGATALLGIVIRIALWSVIVLLVLDNFGVNITTLVAGLGIGGIAIALAVQNVLSDLFASLAIILDKPFVNGDTIMVDSFTGTVEKIGLKTSRLRSVTGEQLVFSNTDLLKSRIRNFHRMQERRVIFQLGMAHDTPVDKLEGIPAAVQALVEREENARFVRAHFKDIGLAALGFEIVYDVLDPDYIVYMDIQQRLNLGICRVLEEQGLSFARNVPLAPSPAAK
ncbi:MAG: mechanosensitive ion channel family protein [Ignavibacteria bacterium]|nr:mechanosensitive ion channel family protein [Ignavibacteria bacterium]